MSGVERVGRWLAITCVAGAAFTASRVAQAAGWTDETIAGMKVAIYVPDTTGEGGKRALLIGLHGCTQKASVLRTSGNFAAAADAYGAVIALPDAPNGGVLAGCWDYYGAAHTRSTKHDGPVIELAQTLGADASRGIDPARVYVAGLSSGGGEAMVLGCLAPDVFSGVGIVAGPTVGTSSFQISQVATNAAAATQTCRTLAGSNAAAFARQRVSIVAGTSDYVVAQGYADLNAEVFRALYEEAGASLVSADIDVTSLPGSMPAGTGTLWSDASGPRVSLVHATGMGHAWPAGSGSGPEISFVAQKGIAYPAYLLSIFEGAPAPQPTTSATSSGTGASNGNGNGAGAGGTTTSAGSDGGAGGADDSPWDDGDCAQGGARASSSAWWWVVAAAWCVTRRRSRRA